MKTFSSLSDSVKSTTSKDQLINLVRTQSGLPKAQIQKMYESFEASGKDWKEINESFKDWLNPKTIVGFKDFFKTFIKKASMLNKQFLTDDEKLLLTDELISSIWETIDNKKVDAINLLNIVSNILILKDPISFGKIVEETGFVEIVSEVNSSVAYVNSYENKSLEEIYAEYPQYAEYQELYESIQPLRKIIQKNSISNTTSGDMLNLQQKLDTTETRLFEGLRDLLAKNNKRWGISYHIENVYQKIMEYLNHEIEGIQNEANIVSVSNNFQEQFFNEIFMGTLNLMYRDVNTLKQLIPDIQTLVFDMMSLVHYYVKKHENEMSYINVDTYNQYLMSVKNLYSLISSSRKRSYVLYNNPDTVQCTNCNDGIFGELNIDLQKLGGYTFDLQMKNVVDMVYTIKSCSTEFNLKIRPVLRNYVTKTFELLGKAEHIILENQKINKYKNY